MSYAAAILIKGVNICAYLLELIIIVRIIYSWIRRRAQNAFDDFIFYVSDLFTEPFRRLLDAIFRALGVRYMPLDFSPLLAVLFINWAASAINRLIWLIFT